MQTLGSRVVLLAAMAGLLVLGASGVAFAVGVTNLVVPLPAGETAITDIGLYQVGWQSYGGKPEVMPVSWVGHADERTGVSYKPWGRVFGKEALLIHSPWRVPPGRTWAEYELALPRTTPIKLSFAIVMGPDAGVPDKSDGSTFSCYLTAAGTERELMREHQATDKWKQFDFDLSQHAGKTVKLRLQVEPGPKNNPSWDWSFFGDAKLTVGYGQDGRTEWLMQLTDTRAYAATSKASLLALSNSASNGVVPSNLLPYSNKLERTADGWRFSYVGADGPLTFTFKPVTGTLDDFTAQLGKGRPFLPATGGGATVARKRENKTEENLAHGGHVAEVRREGDMLNVIWDYDLPDQPLRITWSYRMQGKALVVSARCDQPMLSRFSLGNAAAPLRRTLNVPYLPGVVNYLPVEGAFVCRYLDWTQSHASECPQGEASYHFTTATNRNALAETGYIAVSPDVGEVLPNIPHPASPFLGVLGPRIMLDIWGHSEGSYAGDARKLRELKDLGVDHLAIIQHAWQHYGYDVKLPDHMPANADLGGDDGMKLFGKAANECGYLWALHENYIDLYPDAPSYDATARVLQADGSPSLGWLNEGTKVQAFGIKAGRMIGFAKQNSPEAHARYDTTAAYLDVHSCVPPWNQLDHDATQPQAAMLALRVQREPELFQFERDTHGGPLFGEGANHFYWAGRCDGVEAQVIGGEDHTPFLDLDLLKLHPQMVNHGMGYYERWFRRGYGIAWGVDAGSPRSLDQYRAQELAYGHAGFIGNPLPDRVQYVWREHNLMHPVQRLYGTARPVEIRYQVQGRYVTGSAALVAGDTSRQRIRYDSGLTLWVNWRKEPWRIKLKDEKIAAPAKSSFVFPQWGFLALGPDTEVSTALHDGKLGDYAECPEFIFADARTHFDPVAGRKPKAIEPRLREFRHLGGNRVSVTYEWIVNDTLDKDFTCYVHAVNKGSTTGQNIVFQQDHPLPRPTSQWRKGDVIVDGPYEFSVNDKFEDYDLVIGLYQPGAAVQLQGNADRHGRIQIAKLRLQKQGGDVRAVTAGPVNISPDGSADDFGAHTNPPGTWLDFGKVATDGSLKVNREANRLVIFPYPRDKTFRASLDLKALAPAAKGAKLQVRALAAGTQDDLGPVDFKLEKGRLLLTFGKPGAGRYVVTW
ncbi:MAG: hypothetical protein IT579_14055 [Verrucomicrobia subdivision 3 bacterium]|nr:hypothetical protein [Limisphaerales bacterium]